MVTFYRGEIADRMSLLVDFVPKRTDLASNAVKLAESWEATGASRWFEGLVKDNHGAGIHYMTGLFHPLGFQLDERSFRRAAGRGVELLGSASPAAREELGKLVRLRGAAVHGGFVGMEEALAPFSPDEVRSTSTHAVEAVREVCLGVASSW